MAYKGDLFVSNCPSCFSPYKFKIGNCRQRIARIIPGCAHSLCEECIASLGSKTGQVKCRYRGCSTTVTWNNNMDDFIPNIFLMGSLTYQSQSRLPPPTPDDRLVNFKFVPRSAGITQDEFGQPLCGDCRGVLASVFCRVCAVNLCQLCFDKIHKSSKALSRHQISPVDTKQNEAKELKLLRMEKCKDHPGKPLQYVADGDKLGCDECVIFGNLKGLCVSSLNDQNEKVRIDLTTGINVGKATLTRLKSLYSDIKEEIEYREPKVPEDAILRIKSHFFECHSQLEILENKLIRSLEDQVRREKVDKVKQLQATSSRVSQVANLVRIAEKAFEDSSGTEYNLTQIVDQLSTLENEPCVMIKNSKPVPVSIEIDPMFIELLKNHVNLSNKSASEMNVVPINKAPPEFQDPAKNEQGVIIVNSESEAISLENVGTASSENKLNHEKLSCSREIVPSVYHSRSVSPDTIKHFNGNDIKEETMDIQDSANLVYVPHIVDPGKFYIQKASDISKLVPLKKSLNGLIMEDPPTENTIKEGDLIVARYMEDGNMYRASVSKVNQQLGYVKYTVQFIDYGNYANIKLQDIRELPKRLNKAPPFAVKCSLFGISPSGVLRIENIWSPQSIKAFNELASNNLLHIFEMGQIGDVRQVDLCISPKDNVIGELASIRDILIFRNLATFSSHPTATPIPKPSQTKFFCPNILEKGKSFTVIVSHIVDLGQFWVQLIGENRCWSNCLEDIMEEMQHAYNVENSNTLWPIYAPKVGMICAAIYSQDGKYYRAEVVHLLEDRRVEVNFVDFGNNEITDCSGLRLLFKDFVKIPALAICVSLSDVHPTIGKDFSHESAGALCEMTKLKELLMYVETVQEEGSPFKVALYETLVEKNICINAWIVEEGFASSTSGLYRQVEYLKLDAIPVQKSTNSSQEDSKMKSLTERAKDLILRKMNEGKIKSPKFKVTHAVSPSRIYVRNVDDAEKLSLLNSRLSSWAMASKFSVVKTWTSGSCCMARQDDQTWGRAKIIELKEDDTTNIAIVFFFDSGKIKEVFTQDLKNLSEELKDDPPFAKQVHLSDIIPTGGIMRWSVSTCEQLNKILDATNYIVKIENDGEIIVSADLGVNSQPVKLWITKSIQQGPLEPCKEVEVSLASKLMKKGLALPAKNLESVNQALLLSENLGGILNPTINKRSTGHLPLSNICEAGDGKLLGTSFPSPSSRKSSTKDGSVLVWEEPKKLLLQEFIGMPTHVDWGCNVYIQTIENQENVGSIKEILNSKYSGSRPETHDTSWFPDQCCIVKCDLDNWRRARVIKSGESETFEVEYVDYGYKEWVRQDQMRKNLFAETIPVQCFKLQLAGVVPSNPYGKWSKTALDFIHSQIVDQSLKVSITSELNTKFPVKGRLTTLAGVDISELLIQNGYAKSPSRKDMSSIKKEEKTLINSERLLASSMSQEKQLGNLINPSVSVEQEESSMEYSNTDSHDNIASGYEPKLNAIKSLCLPYKPGDVFSAKLIVPRPWTSRSEAIYCHLDSSDSEAMGLNSETFRRLSDSLQDTWDRQPPVIQPKVGMSVIARFNGDRKWYRAVVTNCCPTLVLFVDYGNSEQVQEVRSLPLEMEQLPVQAVLLNVVPEVTWDQLKKVVSPGDLIRCRLLEIKESLSSGNPVASVEILM